MNTTINIFRERKSDFQSLLILILILLNTAYILYLESISIFCFYIFFFILSIFPSDRKRNVFLLNIGFFVAIFFYEYWQSFFGSSFYGGGYSDDYNFDTHWSQGYYEKYGLNPIYIFKHLYLLEGGSAIMHNSIGYVYLNIVLRYLGDTLGGYHTLIPRFLNIYFLLLTASYASKISLSLWSHKKIASATKYVVFLFPIMLFNSVHIFRDTLISLILVYCIYGYIKHKKNTLFIVFSLFLFGVLFYLRKANCVMLVATCLILIFNPEKIKNKLLLFNVFFALIAVSILLLYGETIFSQINKYTEMNSQRFKGLGGKFFSLPIYVGFIPRLTFLIFVPAIGINTFHQVFLSISTIAQIIFFPFLIFALFNSKIDLRLRIIFLLYFFGVAISTATFRHVMMYLPFAFILVVYQFNTSKSIFNKNYFYVLASLIITFIFSTIIAIIY